MDKDKNLLNEDVEDVNLEAEDFDEDVDDETSYDEDSEDETDADDDSEDSEDNKEKDDAKEKDTRLFNDKQQKEVERLIKTRLDRQETKLVRELSEASGISMDIKEVKMSTKLWGLLSSNPSLSQEVDQLISKFIADGKAKVPDTTKSLNDAQESKLALKEAVLDLKIKDSTFNKYSSKILDWAENEGLDVVDPKTLKLAYMAWKGVQGKAAEATIRTKEQRKQQEKANIKKRGSMQSAKGGKASRSTKTDYGKMNELDLLVSEGLSLFTDD